MTKSDKKKILEILKDMQVEAGVYHCELIEEIRSIVYKDWKKE